jgi:hypothetical protein
VFNRKLGVLMLMCIFMDEQDGTRSVKNPEEAFYNDLPAEIARYHIRLMSTQSSG